MNNGASIQCSVSCCLWKATMASPNAIAAKFFAVIHFVGSHVAVQARGSSTYRHVRKPTGIGLLPAASNEASKAHIHFANLVSWGIPTICIHSFREERSPSKWSWPKPGLPSERQQCCHLLKYSRVMFSAFSRICFIKNKFMKTINLFDIIYSHRCKPETLFPASQVIPVIWQTVNY